MDGLKQVIISYTYDMLPPPHAHEIDVVADLLEQVVNVEFNLKYVDREELTEEEIHEEGFTGEDDFIWKGTLPSAWKDEFINGIELSEEEKEDSLENESIKVVAYYHSGKTKFLNNKISWKYKIQELFQATLESAQSEAPLIIKILAIEKNEVSNFLFKLSFETLTHEIEFSKNGNIKKIRGSWKEGQQLMKEIYSQDYLEEKGIKKTPKANGVWIDPGEGIWYLTGEAVKVGKSPYKAERLLHLLENIIEKHT